MRTLSRYLFFAFLFFLPIQTVWLLSVPTVRGEVFQYGVIGLYGTDLLLLGAVGVLILSGRSAWKEMFPGRGVTEKSLVFLLVFSGLSVVWADERIVALFFVWKLMLAALAFLFARLLVERERDMAVLILMVGAVSQSLLGMWQFLSQTTFSSTLLGMSFYDTWQPGVSVLKNESGRWLRAYGSLPHPNILGGFLVATLVTGVSYLVSRIVHLGRVGRGFFLTGSVIILFGLIVTFSRSAWLGSAIGAAALAVSVWRGGGGADRKNLLVLLGILGIAGTVFVSVLHETVFPRFDQVTIEREGSVVDRAATLDEGARIIREHPLLGVGVGNYPHALLRESLERPIWSVQPAHDVFLLVWAELGIAGLAAFVVLMVSVIRRNLFSFGLLALVPSLFLDHFLWTSHFGLLLLFVLLGFAARGDGKGNV